MTEREQANLKAQITYLKKRISDLEKINLERSWAENPDRSGGSFTEEEIRRCTGLGWN